MPDFIGDIRAVVINVLTELKETMIKEVKGIMTMSHQIDNIGKEREMYKKKKNQMEIVEFKSAMKTRLGTSLAVQ